jgi:L-threonylcarbamoyladenylate synthase
VAFPTDTLYALGANALDPSAIERVLAVKGRHHGKPLSILVPSVEAGMALAVLLPEGVQGLMQAFWPGALTVVVKASPQVPSLLTAATGTVGLRMPPGPWRKRSSRPSAGRSSAAAPTSPGRGSGRRQDRPEGHRGQIDLVLDGGRVALGVPSTVIDCTAEPARILREGAISRAMLQEKIALA